MNNSPNILFIRWWKNEDGSIHYRCRGIGSKYVDFYRSWIPNSSYRCTSEDFPWDYFVFDNPEDHDRLLRDYQNDVGEDV
jgi:hypothetical protein